MSPLIELFVLCVSHGQRRLLSLTVLLIALLATVFAWAQDDDGPYHGSSEPCISVVNAEAMVEGKPYTAITVNKDREHENPRACSLRIAHNMFPIKDDKGQPLGKQAWLRSVYAANNREGQRPTVLRGCVPTTVESLLAERNDEEVAFCPNGITNYYDVPSNGWKAIILIPREERHTYAETQAMAAQAACAEAKSPDAQQKCRDAGQPVGTAADATSSASSQTEEILRLRQKLVGADAKIAEMTKRIAGFDQELAAAKGRAKSDIHPYFWHWIIGLFCMLGLAIGVEEYRIKGCKERADVNVQAVKPSDPTLPTSPVRLRAQLKKADDKVKELKGELAEIKEQARHRLDCDGAEIKALRAERDELEGKLEAKNQETTDLRAELARKNREVLDRDAGRDEAIKAAVDAAVAKTMAEGEAIRVSTERDAAQLREDSKAASDKIAQLEQVCADKDMKIAEQQTKIDLLAGDLTRHAEDETTVAEDGSATDSVAENVSLRAEIDSLRQVNADLQRQLLEVAASSAAFTPPAVTSPTTSTVTSPTPSDVAPPPISSVISSPDDSDSVPDSKPPTLRGFPDAITEEERCARAEAEQQNALEAEAFRNGLPELIRLLKGDPTVLAGLEPAAVMLHAIRLATDRRQEETESAAAEPQACLDADEMLRLDEALQRTSQAKAEAISRLTILQEVVDQMQDKATDPERKALDALFRVAKLEEEIVVLRASLNRLEGKTGDTLLPTAVPVAPADDDPVVEVNGTPPPCYQGTPRTPYSRTLPPPPPTEPTGSDGSR